MPILLANLDISIDIDININIKTFAEINTVHNHQERYGFFRRLWGNSTEPHSAQCALGPYVVTCKSCRVFQSNGGSAVLSSILENNY